MKTILLVTDFSEASENAARYVMGLASQLPISNVIVLHSYASSGPDFAHLTELLDPIIVRTEDSRIDSAQKLESFKALIIGVNPNGIEISTISDERTWSLAIPDLVKHYRTDLLVSGIDPYGKTTDRSTGTAVVKVALDLEIPVLIIPADVRYHPIERLLLACDLKDVAASVPKTMLARLLVELNARLLVVNIDFENRYYNPETFHEQTELHRALDETGAEFFFIEDRDITDGIIRFADEKKVQMIISIPKEQGVFKRLFHPSVTKKLAAVSPFPIMLVHQ